MSVRVDVRAAGREVIERFEAAGQGHVFRFLDDLPMRAAQALVAQAASIDLAHVARLAAAPKADSGARRIAPPGDELVRLGGDTAARREAARERGLEELRAGRVAVVVAAGGQGTRLGSSAPKAMWPAGPTSGKPLLQWHAEKVVHWSRELKRAIPFFVMVSPATARPTADLLRWHRFCGLDATWVRTPCQAELPALDDEGRLLLATTSRIAMAPNGHGGTYRALADAKLLDLLGDFGFTTISYVQVDNPLIQPVDPVFVGLHVEAGSRISSKSVVKTGPSEQVGVFARIDGSPAIVEYSELTPAQSEATDVNGELLYGQGNIAAHCIDLAFAQEMARTELPVHRARKSVRHVDGSGNAVTPSAPNATKLETFLFDAIPLAEQSLVMETSRAREFSPIKNATGTDSPESARNDLVALFRGWHDRAGVPAARGLLEVDPRLAPDEEAFRRLHGVATGA